MSRPPVSAAELIEQRTRWLEDRFKQMVRCSSCECVLCAEAAHRRAYELTSAFALVVLCTACDAAIPGSRSQYWPVPQLAHLEAVIGAEPHTPLDQAVETTLVGLALERVSSTTLIGWTFPGPQQSGAS